MIYIIFLLLSSSYFYTLGFYKQCGYWKIIGYSFPIILFWCLIIGCQYGIGTDYFSYIDIFKGHNLNYITENRGEYLFSFFPKVTTALNLNPQWGFIFISLIEILLLIYVMYRSVPSRYIYLFFFTFICFSGTFHNQMNGLRQYLALYLVSISVFLICDRRYISVLLIYTAAFFIHKSSAIILPIVYFLYRFRNNYTTKTLLIALCVGVVMSLFMNNQIIGLIVPYFDVYSHYFTSDRIESYGMIQKLTKYIYLPIIIWAIIKLPKFELSKYDCWLFTFGVYGFALKLSVMSLTIVSRIGLYLEIISCIPITYLLIYIHRKSQIKTYLFLLLYIIVPYAVKVILMKTGEYDFDSIFLHWNTLQ